MSAGPVIRLRGVHKRYGARVVLAGCDLELAAGGRLGLIGPPGCGKTVLVKLVAGLERADAGTVEVLGVDLGAADEDTLGAARARIGMLFQNGALFDFLDVAGNVAFPLRQRAPAAGGAGVDEAALAAAVAARLRAVGLAGSEHKLPSELSGGMRRRVGIARATVARPELTIYDEPTAGLDPVTTAKIYALLTADQREHGGTAIAISSDVVALAAWADELAYLDDGRIRYRGPAATIADAPDAVVRRFVRGDLDGG